MTECRIRKRCKLARTDLSCCSDGQLPLRIRLESTDHKGMTDEDTRSVRTTPGKDRPHRVIMCLDRFVLARTERSQDPQMAPGKTTLL